MMAKAGAAMTSRSSSKRGVGCSSSPAGKMQQRAGSSSCSRRALVHKHPYLPMRVSLQQT